MIPDEAVEAAAKAYRAKVEWIDRHSRDDYGREDELGVRAALEAAAPHLLAQTAVDAILGMHRQMPCLDEDGDPIGGSYCEACKDLDDHSGERVHEVYPCMTVREITKAFTGQQSYADMRDEIERMVRG